MIGRFDPHRRAVLWGGFAVTAAFLLPGRGARAQALKGAERRAGLARIEGYLNSITTVKAGFLQVASTGEVARGTFYMRRPGRLRIEYDPPSPVLIVGDGHRLIYYDKELQTANMTPIDDTLAGFLAREHIRFSGDVTASNLIREKGTARVTLARTGEPEGGSLTLVFNDDPLRLRLWIVTDAQGTSTRVALSEPEFGLTLSDDLFEAREPDRP